MTAIEVRQLGKAFGRTRAVHDLTFTVPAGTVTGFLGPNGAGKTTTLKMLLGLVRPTSGTATLGGRPYARLVDPAQKVGAVLETTGFHCGLTARRHLASSAVAIGVAPERVGQTLREMDLDRAADRRVGTFSLGMRQRLAIGRALLGRPGVLVLDEPANGLDPEGIHWLRALLRRFAGDGGTVLISSHVLAEIEQVADEVIIIDRGRLLATGPLDGVVAAAGVSKLEEAYLRLLSGDREVAR